MKIKSFLLIVLLVFLSSCKSEKNTEALSLNPYTMTAQLTQREYDTSIAQDEMSRERTENRIPFTMNFVGCLGKPVIDLNEEGKHIYMQIDSGCTKNWFFKSLLEKMDITEDQYLDIVLEEIKDTLTKEHPEILAEHQDDAELIQFLKKQWDSYNLNYLANISYTNHVLRYDTVRKDSYDGVLGAEYLLKYDRVTFDYVNNYIILNDEKLDGTALQMYLSPADEILIYIDCNDSKEIAMIDTGNYCFTPRHDFGDGMQDYQIDEESSSYGIAFNGKVPVTPRVMRTYNGIKIGHVTYDNMKGAYSTIRGSGYNKGAQYHLIKLNGLGNVFFYNHIIQFDFADKQFIIK